MNKNLKILISFLIIITLGVIGWGFLTMPDNRSTGQRVGQAIDELPNGVDKAAKKLESRTPGEKIGDAIKDTGETVKEKTAN